MGMRVVLTAAWSWPEVRRGGERYLHELGAALTRAGHDVRVLSTGAAPSHDEVLGVRVDRVRRRHPRSAQWGAAAPEIAFGAQSLARLATARFDVWHAVSIPDGAAAASLGRVRPGLRSVFTELGFPSRRSRERRADHRLQQTLARHIDSYVCFSQAAGSWLRSDYDREPDVVSPGVDLERFRPAGRRHGVPVVMYSGSLTEPRKNVAKLLEAVALVRRTEPVEVWLCGQGDVDAVLAAAPPAAREAVTFAGHASDEELAERYAAAWVLALPSQAEAFGMVLTEALASGTPILVAVDGGGPNEIVTPEVGVAAVTEPEPLADALREVFALAQRPRIAETCRARAAEFDWTTVVIPTLERIYGG